MTYATSPVALLQQCVDRWWRTEESKRWNNHDSALQRILQHGWLVPYLIELDQLSWRRWDYWFCTMEKGALLNEPIPQIVFGHREQRVDGEGSHACTHLEHCLDLIPNCGSGSWQSWGNWTYFDYLMDWLLYGFGYPGQPRLPAEPVEGSSVRLYQYFNLGVLLAEPYDYLGGILAANKHGRHLAFYPTPHNVVELMVRMTFCDETDHRLETVSDPCLGTGRMLLHSSKHSLRLYGMDLNPTVIKVSLVNGFLYAPWLVKPFPFLDPKLTNGTQVVADPDMAQPVTVDQLVSDRLAAVGQQRSDVASYLADTEHDADNQWKFTPIKKRRRKGARHHLDTEIVEQGQLF